MKIKPIKQKNSIACGPTCIYLCDRYLGGSNTFERIERMSQYKKKGGMDDVDIVNCLLKMGYKVKRFLNSDWQDLKKYNKKDSIVIVSWMVDGYKGHVSILDKVDDKSVWLIDSDKGKVIKIEKIKFMRLWMEYDGYDWPKKSSDINLRSMIVVSRL